MAPKIIVIDPGHGGNDPGAVGSGLIEKELSLDIAQKIVDELSQYHVEVHLTRNADQSLSLSQRAKFANNLNADFFLSVHINAGGGSGFESYVHTTENPNTVELRRIIHHQIIDYLSSRGIINRGLKSANFAVLRETVMPAVLLEYLFIDHPQDAAMLKDQGFHNLLALATAAGLAKALGLALKEGRSKDYNPNAEINKLKEAGLIDSPHLASDPITWGEFATVINRLLKNKNLANRRS